MGNSVTPAALTALLLLYSAAVAAAPAPETEEEPAARGAVLYRLYCGSCHGSRGRGDGPLVEDLNVAVPDLTRISRRHHGRFPRLQLTRVLDGRAEVEAHGSREMPIWGLSLRQEGRLEDQEEEVRQQIRDLLAYLESIQLDADAKADD